MLGFIAVAVGAVLIYYLSSPTSKPATSRERYESLRARAIKAGDSMAATFEESRKAYDRGERKKAKELSNEGKLWREQMETLNTEASELVFRGILLFCRLNHGFKLI